MSSQKSSSKMQIIVALIGFIGVITAALIANGTKLFPPDQTIPEENLAPLKNLSVSAAQGSPSVKVGEMAAIYVTVKGEDRMVLEGATVLISAGGGKFLESKDETYDPSSRLHGPYSVSGKTKSNGVYSAYWTCNPCSKSYGMTVTVSKKGYKNEKIQETVKVIH